ncbi:MAG: DNA polymerase/3'-5' exonuclease PolX [Candidatus Hydrogenedentes bacterium]|nr:DNA polymerase/3'-5' exonuclease PolX [Candidatus Hydrogenedentota bacterium]
MANKEVVQTLEEIASLLELAGESPFKGRAYLNVARRIEQLDEDVSVLAQEGRLREIKGVGDALEQKITEYVSTGALQYLQTLRARFPESLFDLFRIPGLGAKRVRTLYSELGIESLEGLERACEDDTLSALKGFGPKMVEKIRQGIAFAKQHEGLHLYKAAANEAQRLKNLLSDNPAVVRVDVAGSIRRHNEIIKDVDLVAASSDAASIMEQFVNDAEVATITGHGDTKSSVVLQSGIAVDLRVVSEDAYPYALLHFTGSKEHNVALRQRAKERGLKLNEYGLFRGEEGQDCTDETAIYAALDLPFIPPELREDMGELELDVTPELVEMDHLLGMIHCHTLYSDGRATIEEMALAAQERGYQYLTITDHSQAAVYAGGLTPERVREQHDEIDRVNKTLKNFRLLKGIESDILSDGSLDYEEDLLATFDLVIASVHSKLDMTQAEATKRVVRAIENPYTTILGHPTARLLLSRKGYPLDFDAVFEACAAHNVAIEINANCRRLDLDWRLVRKAKERGLKFSIGPDAHSVEGLDDMIYGIGIARKGWLEPGDVLNTMTADEFLAWRGTA